MDGWVNLDSDPSGAADVVCSVPPLPVPGASVDEIYAGHYLEHLSQEDGRAFLRECWRALRSDGVLAIVVPDTREILRRYLVGTGDVVEMPAGRYWQLDDLDDVCAAFVFSTVQPSHHLWAYDQRTLRRALEQSGFRVTRELDRYRDPRIAVAGWHQFGLEAVKP